MISCGLGVLENRKIGLYDINVMKQHRRNGVGTKICQAIINEGIKNGADTAYLQVASLNEKAIQLYNSLGFKKLYGYWYRVKNH
jgi:ribosomal protein S18 acetylase RimI-like enzyme